MNETITGILEKAKSEVADRIRELRAESDRLVQQADGLEEVVGHLSASIDFLSGGAARFTTTAPDWPSLSLPDALVELARRDGGELRTADAIRELVELNVCQSFEQARNGIYRAIERRPQFQKVEEGLYRLGNPSEPARVNGNRLRPAAILLPLVQANPSLTKEQALHALHDAHYNFRGGSPGRVAATALAHARGLAGVDSRVAPDAPPAPPEETVGSASAA